MSIAFYLWMAVQILIGYNLLLPIILYLLYLVRKNRPIVNIGTMLPEADYAIIVTAYEQTGLLPAVVASLQKLKYSNYLIYIVADKCDISNLNFKDPRVIVLRPQVTLASNTRSHFYAIKNFKRNHERLTIIDSDNLVHPEYLNELNKYFEKGFEAVQGVREAKNLNSTYACLDAARDIYYHFYDGEVLFRAGSSATLAGSGMAFTTSLYRQCLEHLDITGAGFDKVLQYQILKRNKRIAFASKAIVFDEKTSKSDQLVKQRARWINTWFKYFTFGFKLVKSGIVRLNWNQFLFGIILLRPPLFIFLLLSAFFMFLNLFIYPIVAVIWSAAFLLFIAGFFISLSQYNTNKRIYQSLVNIPKFIFYQLVSLVHVRSANKKSVATVHYHNMEVENLPATKTTL